LARNIDVTVNATTRASREDTFDVIVPIDLSTIFKRWLFIPGVEGVRDQSGPWDTAGQTRTVLLSDGTSAAESLTSVNRPEGFSYRVGPFPRPLGLLANSANGSWTFTSKAKGVTAIRWTYSFQPAPGRAWLVRFIIAPAWRRYAQRGLDLAVAQVEHQG
jgi:hypothetical protein